ncbi:bifunctional DNA primase/polymerase [Pseudonocardia xinjiangensis]|uniref:Bifunctional DNA primase/polymerase n=1 Tax=Pseudonocardia xinjiangensis TaxID=75289 RepID=A0ABX1R5K6_9PSEU|nr:bifunctional DNA primase/polymerase [Pseudonocardia xinjiangensis]NMH75672.1 bifunctional DNA primase/polymerase [Pseudonocardia xinjiangensis]
MTTTPDPRTNPQPGSGLSKTTGTRLGRVAAAGAEAGRYVFPVHPRSKLPAVKDWEATATRDLEQIKGWWAHRPYNIGIATGKSGLVVLDLDLAHGYPPPESPGVRGGFDVLARLAAGAGEPWPPRTLVVATPAGGTHWYFRQPAGVELRNTQGAAGRGLGWCVDTRGHGGYVLGSGSVSREGSYRSVRRYPIAPFPDWLVTVLSPQPPSITVGTRTPASGSRAAAYLRAVVTGELAAVTAAGVGERHITLLRAARRLGHWVGSGALAETEARTALTEAAGQFVGVAGYTAAHVERDITDGLTYGARLPRSVENTSNPIHPANSTN